MSQQHQLKKTYSKADVQLAISDIQTQQIRTLRRAESVYNVPRRTIQQRRANTLPRRDCEPPAKRLTKLEEKAVVQRILEQSERGLPCSKADVRDMADKLLRERGSNAVGKN
jgi:hypothetical protein